MKAPDPPDAVLRRARELGERADDLHERGHLAQAIPLAREALALKAQALGADQHEVLEQQNDLAVMLADRGALGEARDLYGATLAALEASLGLRHPDVAVVLNNLAELELQTGEVASARGRLERAVEIWSDALGADHPNVATALSHLALGLDAAGDVAGARDAMRRALAAREAALGPDHPDVARAESSLAGLLEDADPDEAVGLARRALATLERALGPDHPDVATTLSRLAFFLLDTSPDEAVALLERALAIREVALAPGHPQLGYVLGHLGLALQHARRLAEAEEPLSQAVTVLETAFGPDHPDVGLALNNLGTLLVRRGAHERAHRALTQALAVREAALGPDHPDVAETLNNLAELHHERGAYQAARPLLDCALAVREAALGPDHPDVAAAATNLGMLLDALGDRDRARPYLERALQIWEVRLGPDHPHVALARDNLAEVLHEAGDSDAAIDLLERALDARERVLGPDHPDVAYTLNNLGALFQDEGLLEEARAFYEQALDVRQRALGPDHPDVGQSLNNLGALLREVGDLDGARDAAERALRVFERAFGSDHPDLAVALMNLAHIAGEGGRPEAAAAYALRAARTLEGFLRVVLPTLALAEQQAFLDRTVTYATGVLFSYTSGTDAFHEGYALLAGWKGVLLEGLRQQTAFLQTADSTAEARDLAETRARLARAARDDQVEEVEALERQRERLERLLTGVASESPATDPWQQGGLAVLVSALPETAAFIDVYVHDRWAHGGEPWVTAVVTTREGSRVVDVGSASDVGGRVRAWRSGRWSDATTTPLVEAVWAPLVAVLPEGIETVWVSADGLLHRIPWGLLTGPDEPPVVVSVPSARALLALLTVSPPPVEPRVLLVGDVDYGMAPEGTVAPYEPLRHSAFEIDCIQRRVVTGDAIFLTENRATKTAVVAAAAGATVLHLATHGAFGRTVRPPRTRAADRSGRWGHIAEDLAREDPEVRSPRSPLVDGVLALAGANEGSEGVLTAEELVGLPLRGARLVVLSTCESGRGAEIPGQGVLGVQAVFQAAGARTVLASLWRVPDEATAALMDAFYRGLWGEGLSVAAALHRAQEEVRDRPGWRAPVFWAGWVLSGDAGLAEVRG